MISTMLNRSAMILTTCTTVIFFSACVDVLGGEGGPQEWGGVTERFRVEVPPGFRFQRPALDDERLYADLAEASGVVALDRATGKEVWRFQRPRGGPASLSTEGGRVFFVGDYAIALDAATGEEVWRFEPNGHGGLGESEVDDTGLYFGTDRQIYALNVDDGSPFWQTDVGPDWEYRSIVRGVSVGGDTVYASVERYVAENGHRAIGYIFALDRHTGEVLWTFAEGDGSDRHWFSTAPAVADEWLLISDYQANVYIALDRMTGDVRWRTAGDQSGFFGAAERPFVSNDTVYVVGVDRRALALTLNTGVVVWSTTVAASVISFATCGSRILAVDGGMHVLERSTGAHLADLYDDTASPATLWVSRFAVDGNQAYVLGNRHAFAYECPD